MGTIPDVDLDVGDREAALAALSDITIASQLVSDESKLVEHKTGLYLQNIPTDPLEGWATYPYDIAEDLGYYKIDVIPFKVYEGVESEAHLAELLAHAESEDFDWLRFLDGKYYSHPNTDLRVTHLANHMDVVEQYPPQSVEDVAILIALIRPRKKYLIGEPWEVVKDKIWKKLPEEDSDKKGNYFFKKSHAVAFALVILIHLQLLDSQLEG